MSDSATTWVLFSIAWAVFGTAELVQTRWHARRYGGYRGMYLAAGYWFTIAALGGLLAWGAA